VGALGLTAAAGVGASQVLAAGKLRPIKLAWNANAVCLAPVPVAIERGIFEKNGLQVELINYTGSTDQLLESIATTKADAGVGMIHRWIKPLESGFDVKLVSSSHGGCTPGGLRAGRRDQPAKAQGQDDRVSDLNSPGKNFFSVLFTKAGIDPEKDVTWRQFPGDLLGVAVEKGEAQAIADGDPNLFLIERKTKGLVELATNLSGEYANKTCCVLGVSGKLAREDRATAAALARSINEASDFVASNPNEARIYSPYSKVSVDDLRAVLGTLTHKHHPSGWRCARRSSSTRATSSWWACSSPPPTRCASPPSCTPTCCPEGAMNSTVHSGRRPAGCRCGGSAALAGGPPAWPPWPGGAWGLHPGLAQQAGGLQRLELHRRVRRFSLALAAAAGRAEPGRSAGRPVVRARARRPWLTVLGLGCWPGRVTAKLGWLPTPSSRRKA
jgi:NitT/TauT family transport system substrate-binding protein